MSLHLGVTKISLSVCNCDRVLEEQCSRSRNSMCKGPEAHSCLVDQRNSKYSRAKEGEVAEDDILARRPGHTKSTKAIATILSLP